MKFFSTTKAKPTVKDIESSQKLLFDLAQEPSTPQSNFETLLEKGIDPYIKDAEGISAFEYATANNPEAMQAMYKYFPNEEYREIVKERALDQIKSEINKGNFGNATKIALYNTDLETREYAEEYTKAKGLEILIQEDISRDESIDDAARRYIERNKSKILFYETLVADYGEETAQKLYSGKNNLSDEELLEHYPEIDPRDYRILTSEDVQIKAITEEELTTPKIEEFKRFLDKKPLLGESLSNSLAERALEFATENYTYHPQMLDKIVTLVMEQNPENSPIKKQLAARLVELSNDAKSLRFILDNDEYVRKLDPTNQTGPIYKLSTEEKGNLYSIAARIADLSKALDTSEGLSEADIVAFHTAYQGVKWDNVPKNIKTIVDSSISLYTEKFINRQIENNNMEPIDRIVEISANTPAFMDSIGEEADFVRSSRASSESSYSTRTSRTSSMDNQEPSIKTADDLSDYIYKKAVFNIVGRKTTNLPEDSLKKFIEFLDQNPPLGNPQSEDSLCKRAVEIALNHLKTHPEILTKVTNIILEEHGNDIEILRGYTDLLTTKSIESRNTEEREAIFLSLTKMKDHLRYETPEEFKSFADEAINASDLKLLNAMILENKQHQIHLNPEGLASLYKNGYQEAAQSLLFDPKAVAHYLSHVPENDHETIKFIYDNKGDHPIQLNQTSMTKLLDTALARKDNTMLIGVMDEIAATEEASLFSAAVTHISTKEPQKFSSILKEILVSETIKEDTRANVAEAVLKDDQIITTLNSENIDNLAKFYSPTTSSKRFLPELLNIKYSKGISEKDFSNSLSLSLEKLQLTDSSEFKDVLSSYLTTRATFEKKPLITRFKAWFSGKRLETYKQDLISSTVKPIEMTLERHFLQMEKPRNIGEEIEKIAVITENSRKKTEDVERETQKRIAIAKDMSKESLKAAGVGLASLTKVIDEHNKSRTFPRNTPHRPRKIGGKILEP